MAVVEGFSKETIRAFQKTVDFYYWKGIPVARAWPDWSNFKPSANQKLSMAAMAASRVGIKQISPELRKTYRALTFGKRANWLDVVTGSFLRGWKITRANPPVLLDIVFEKQDTQWKITAQFDHSSNIYASVLSRVYVSETEYHEKKGMDSPCVEPPFGPLVLDPDTPPEDPPVPFRSRGEKVLPEGVEVGWGGGNYLQASRVCHETSPGGLCGCFNAWRDWRYQFDSGFTGGAADTLWEFGKMALYLGGPRWKLNVGAQLPRDQVVMSNWYNYYPDTPPATVRFYVEENSGWPIRGGVHLSSLPDVDWVVHPGWQWLSAPCPSSWYGGAYVYGWWTPAWRINWCPPQDDELYGAQVRYKGPGTKVILHPAGVGAEYNFYIPREIVEPQPDPRILFCWDIFDPFPACSQVPVPFPK